jgi:hypothetical protein
MVQEYVTAGEFTKSGRFWAAFWANVIFYGVIGVIAAGALL